MVSIFLLYFCSAKMKGTTGKLKKSVKKHPARQGRKDINN